MNLSWPLIMSVPKEVTHDELYDTLRRGCDRFIKNKEEAEYLSSNHNAGVTSIRIQHRFQCELKLTSTTTTTMCVS